MHLTRKAAGIIGCSALGLFGIVAPAASGTQATAGIIHVTSRAGSTNTSDNWSGYNIGADYPGEATGTTFSSIQGGWIVPTATQHTAGQAEDSATWIGIGGGCVNDTCTVTDSTLIQAGTEQDVAANGSASYYSWYELIPKTETRVSLPVKPGDKVGVRITETAPTQWTVLIKDLTSGRSFTKSVTYTSSMDTAEWIEETPLELGIGSSGLAHLPNLGTVHIRQALLNGVSPDFQTLDELQLDDNGTILATPSAPLPTENGFDDCSYATSCPTP